METFNYAQNTATPMMAHEWWDLAHAKFPRTLKSMFRLLRVTYHTSSDIGALVNIKASYVITAIRYQATKSGSEVEKNAATKWRTLLERTLRVYEHEKAMLVDFEVFGNAFVMVAVPWLRYFTCKNCSGTFNDTRVDATSGFSIGANADYFTGVCPLCKKRGRFEYEDKLMRTADKMKLIRVPPEDITIEYNPLTDEREYTYTLPQGYAKKLQDGKNWFLLKTTPKLFLQAAVRQKPVILNRRMLYHMINTGAAQHNAAWGFPPMIHVLRDTWLQQTIKKAQEQIATDHILPWTIVSPAANVGVPAPAMGIDLGQMKTKIEQMVEEWRKDPNRIHVMPTPVTVENLRGDAANLNVSNDISLLRQSIAAAFGLPSEVLYGSVSWSGANVSLRISENQLLRQHEQLERFLAEFLIPTIKSISQMPDIDIGHLPFKMADDVQMKQLIVDLHNNKLLSAQTALSALGFDYNVEKDRIDKELDDMLDLQARMSASEAESQAAAQVIQAKYQVLAQQAAMDNMTPEMQQQMMMQQQPEQMDPQMKQGMAKMAANIMFAPPQLKLQGLAAHRGNFLRRFSLPGQILLNDKLHPQVKAEALKPPRRTDMRPLPDQRPPRRDASPI